MDTIKRMSKNPNRKVEKVHMVQISRKQADYIREHFPFAHINKTCKKKNKGKSRGKYYVAEHKKVMNYLKDSF